MGLWGDLNSRMVWKQLSTSLNFPILVPALFSCLIPHSTEGRHIWKLPQILSTKSEKLHPSSPTTRTFLLLPKASMLHTALSSCPVRILSTSCLSTLDPSNWLSNILHFSHVKTVFLESYTYPISWIYFKMKHFSKNIYADSTSSLTTYYTTYFETAKNEFTGIINNVYTAKDNGHLLVSLYLMFCLSSQVYFVDHSMVERLGVGLVLFFTPGFTHSSDFLVPLVMPVSRFCAQSGCYSSPVLSLHCSILSHKHLLTTDYLGISSLMPDH